MERNYVTVTLCISICLSVRIVRGCVLNMDKASRRIAYTASCTLYSVACRSYTTHVTSRTHLSTAAAAGFGFQLHATAAFDVRMLHDFGHVTSHEWSVQNNTAARVSNLDPARSRGRYRQKKGQSSGP